jgi:predicted dehydrogenase
MAPHADSSVAEEDVIRQPPLGRPPMSERPPRFMIIGAGSRGNTYAKFIGSSSNGVCAGVVDPIARKRQRLGSRFIWGKTGPVEGQEFQDWKDFVLWELERRKKALRGEVVPEGVDGVFICVQDGLHKEVILGLAPLSIHIMCEKPLATTLADCVSIYKTLSSQDMAEGPSKLFSIGHVLRYSPHNMLLRKLLLEDNVIGDIVSINHTEPVGWWHFSHSYVRYVTTFKWQADTKRKTEGTGVKSRPRVRHY